MTAYNKWNRKGTTISEAKAIVEYGVDRDFIVKGIREGKLEYQEGVLCSICATWGGSPYIMILRKQLEKYIVERQGPRQLTVVKNLTELKKVKSEISQLKRKLNTLEVRKNKINSTGPKTLNSERSRQRPKNQYSFKS
jgi:hypothetical protein